LLVVFEGVFLRGVASAEAVFDFRFGFLASSACSISSSLFLLRPLAPLLALFSFSSSINTDFFTINK